MSEPESTAPAEPSPFWRFSLRFYAVPGVAPACIELQDRAGVDVNVLFFLLWNAAQGRTLSQAEVADIDRKVGAWRDVAVVPLRSIRRALRTPPAIMAADVAEGFRNRIKAAELEAERLQQEALYRLAQPVIGSAAPSAVEAARASIAAYQAVLRPFPPGPLDTVLTAFAKFETAGKA